MPSKEKKSRQAAPDSIYVNRELSWLAFNKRVLLEAADPKVPLLERLKFLMIYQSNLEEFFRYYLACRTFDLLNRRDVYEGFQAYWKDLGPK